VILLFILLYLAITVRSSTIFKNGQDLLLNDVDITLAVNNASIQSCSAVQPCRMMPLLIFRSSYKSSRSILCNVFDLCINQLIFNIINIRWLHFLFSMLSLLRFEFPINSNSQSLFFVIFVSGAVLFSANQINLLRRLISRLSKFLIEAILSVFFHLFQILFLLDWI